MSTYKGEEGGGRTRLWCTDKGKEGGKSKYRGKEKEGKQKWRREGKERH